MQSRKPKKTQEVQQTRRKVGRPKGAVIHSQSDHQEKIIDWISNGNTLRDYCRQNGAPSFSVVYKWLDNDAEFSKHFARARDIGYDVIEQECLAIADNQVMSTKTVTTKDGEYCTTEDHLYHRKLQVETRLKLLARWRPNKLMYDIEQRTKMSVDDDSSITINFVTSDAVKST